MHFLVSMVLVWLAVLLGRGRHRRATGRRGRSSPRRSARLVARRRSVLGGAAGRGHAGHRGGPARRRRRDAAARPSASRPGAAARGPALRLPRAARRPRVRAARAAPRRRRCAAVRAAGRGRLAQGALGGVQYALGRSRGAGVAARARRRAGHGRGGGAVGGHRGRGPVDAAPTGGPPGADQPTADLDGRSWHARGADHRHGGPEVLELVELADPSPGRASCSSRSPAAGVNYIDTYQPQRRLPDRAAVRARHGGRRPGGGAGPGVTRVRRR